jgi:hypothetical protein
MPHGSIRSKSGSVCCNANVYNPITLSQQALWKPRSLSTSPITTKRPSQSAGLTPSRSLNTSLHQNSESIYDCLYLALSSGPFILKGHVLRKQIRAKLKPCRALILVGEVSRGCGSAMHTIKCGFISSLIIGLAEEPHCGGLRHIMLHRSIRHNVLSIRETGHTGNHSSIVLASLSINSSTVIPYISSS